MPATVSADAALEAQLKRKRSLKEKPSVSATSKRQKSSHAEVAVNGHASPASTNNIPSTSLPATASPAQRNSDAPRSTPKSDKKQKRTSLQGHADLTPSAKHHVRQTATSDQAADLDMQDGMATTQKRSGRTRRSRRKPREGGDQVDKSAPAQTVVSDLRSSSWSVSKPIGGRYISHDPIFSSDERFLFASNGLELRVLSVATSLVEKTLPPPDAPITAFAASATDADEVYVASSGSVQRWDWISGAAVNDALQYDGLVHAVSTAASQEQEDVVYALVQNGEEWHILLGSRIIYTSKYRLSHFQVQANYIMAASPGKLVVGRPIAPETVSDEPAAHEFVEIKTSFDATCLDGKVATVDAPRKKAKHVEELTVAVGNPEGAILVYEDVFSVSRPVDVSLAPRIMHWHREPVSTIKWSRDGNYLISGGRETVLVLWQLATGRKQFLPHLTAEIQRLTVSPSGTSYAIQLADNSVMVLSTSELKPTANFAGLQAQSVPVVEKASSHLDIDRILASSAAALHPINKHQLLVAVAPSSNDQSEGSTVVPRPFLQTYDISTDRHISRQALTRNHVTDFNKGPLGNKIRVPDVTHLRISDDGQWLATAEEWSPPVLDVAYLAANRKATDDERLERREVYLKIWRWNADKNVWALESRIDSPHQNTVDLYQGRILGLEYDPTELGFATIGEDSCVRIWKPKTRLRNGIVVRGSNDEGLVDWACRHTIKLGRSFELVEDETLSSSMTIPTSAAIAFSDDGSMLAVSQAFDHSTSASVVHFVNAATGLVAQTRAGLFTGKIQALSFLGRYLIILSDTSVHVWDVVDEVLQYASSLNVDSKIASTILLTVSREDFSFAVSTSTRTTSRVQIYNLATSVPALVQTLSDPITALLAGGGRKGYTVLTSTAKVFTLLPKGATVAATAIAQPASTALVATDISAASDAAEDDMDTDMEGAEDSASALEAAGDIDEADKPVVRPEQLARIFDADNVALMPVRDMFDAVVGLYARRPRPSVQAGAA
ncbi:hypothetical protein MBLNU459_g7891t1 [Dothideomycetes sp. NU459]